MNTPRLDALAKEIHPRIATITAENAMEQISAAVTEIFNLATQLETELCAAKKDINTERKKVAKLRKVLANLTEPCTRSDYTVADLDRVVCNIAKEALEATK